MFKNVKKPVILATIIVVIAVLGVGVFLLKTKNWNERKGVALVQSGFYNNYDKESRRVIWLFVKNYNKSSLQKIEVDFSKDNFSATSSADEVLLQSEKSQNIIKSFIKDYQKAHLGSEINYEFYSKEDLETIDNIIIQTNKENSLK